MVKKWNVVNRTHIVTSAEETASVVIHTEDFKGKREIEILQMTVYNGTNPYLPHEVAFIHAGSYHVLDKGICTGQNGISFVGPIKVFAEGLAWIVRRPAVDEEIIIDGMWRYLD